MRLRAGEDALGMVGDMALHTGSGRQKVPTVLFTGLLNGGGGGGEGEVGGG